MSLPEDLRRQHQLHRDGALTDHECTRAKARLIQQGEARSQRDAIHALRRSRGDRTLGSACGSLATATGMASWVVRLIGVLLAFWGAPACSSTCWCGPSCPTSRPSVRRDRLA